MTISLNIEGMHCGGCASSVEKAALSVSGVRNVTVDLEGGKLTADLDDPGLMAKLKDAIEQSGFDVTLPAA